MKTNTEYEAPPRAAHWFSSGILASSLWVHVSGDRAGGVVIDFGTCIDMRAGFVSVVAAGACVGSDVLRFVALGFAARKHRKIIALRGPKAQQYTRTQSPAHDGCTTCVSVCGSLPGWRTENGVGGAGSCSRRYDEQNLEGPEV